VLKPTNKFFTYSQIGLDILAIVLAYFGSFWIRFLLNPLFSRQFSPKIMPALMPPIYLCVLILLIVLNYFGIYELRKKKTLLDIFLSVFQCVSLGTAVLLSITFLFKAEGYSRSLIVIFWGTSILSLTVSHVLGVRLLSWSKLKDFGLERIAIVGINTTTAKIAERIKKYDKNYRFEGYIQDERTDETQLTPRSNTSSSESWTTSQA
jgi:FlaA1/EpsC-like NDP-sugar epimerase